MRGGKEEEGNSMVIYAVCIQVVVQKRLRCVCRGGRAGCVDVCAEVGEGVCRCVCRGGRGECVGVCVEVGEGVCRCVYSHMSYLGLNFADCPLSFKVTGHCKWASFLIFP